ncbi:hypothetical protein GCM10010156_16980 [Planobispora rosea]|uniref:CBM2 domain-containing protein n=2 Tax=Planobispora rosea TaxID=35762 RepID=A0A8J3WD30_PLARO|nr:hypothetical protein GCM10010156_16980 [Planobispora rosea]GIH84693.1 hypothetical protein Pro02_31010 [Planobispora rosea]
MTLLTVTAVAAVTVGTVAGVQAWKTSAESAAGCSSGDCLAAGTGQPPEPDVTDTAGPAEEPTPRPDSSRKAAPPERAETSPEPVPVATRRDRVNPSSSPRAPRDAETEPPADDPPPTRDPLPTEEPSPFEEQSPPQQQEGDPFSTDEWPESTPERTPTPAPTVSQPPPSKSPETSLSAGDGTVTVDFRSERKRSRAYTARLVVTADRDLSVLRLSLPVSGEVTSLDGAEWRQVGGTLVMESPRAMVAGEELVISFAAQGRMRTPQTCRSTPGDCTIA